MSTILTGCFRVEIVEGGSYIIIDIYYGVCGTLGGGSSTTTRSFFVMQIFEILFFSKILFFQTPPMYQ